MECKLSLETKTTDVKILRSEGSKQKIELVFEELDNLSVNLADSNVNDVKELFDSIFQYIVKNKFLISFELKDESNDLFAEVAKDIIVQLNNEIKQSESNFTEIIALNPKKNEEVETFKNESVVLPQSGIADTLRQKVQSTDSQRSTI